MNAPTIVQDGWNNISTPELQPKLYFAGGKISIDAHPSPAPGAEASYAFYLYKDGERIETSWYGPDSSAVFNRKIEPGSYHGRVFLKLPHVYKPVLIRETKQVVFTLANINHQPSEQATDSRKKTNDRS